MTGNLPVFLTAFDPAELPGGSVDPLGFTAGYLALADEFFPGMTAAAGQATYLPMMCAGLHIAESAALHGLSAAAARKARVEIAMRLERYWALACVLHLAEEEPELERNDADVEGAGDRVPGLRGVTYVRKVRERLSRDRAVSTNADFALLAQQYRYGAFGIYGSVGEDLRLFDKATLAPTPGFGGAIGEGFLESTMDARSRKELVRATRDGSATVRVETLRRWGKRAFPGSPLEGAPKTLLNDALVHDLRRARMLEALTVAVERHAAGDDRARLAQCAHELGGEEDGQLRTATAAALGYDTFLRQVTLIFERVLWLCRRAGDQLAQSAVFDDDVVQQASARLPTVAASCLERCNALVVLGRRDVRTRGRHVLELAEGYAGTTSVETLVTDTLSRHSAIQRGKVEHGRPKQPWIEKRDRDFALTSTRVGVRAGQITSPEQVRAPDWRVGAGLSFIQLVGGVRREEAN